MGRQVMTKAHIDFGKVR